MRKIITIAATSLMIAVAIPVYASSDDASCGQSAAGQHLSAQDIKDKAAGMGYSVRNVKRENGCFEVYATNKEGARVELYMNPVTGAILKIKNKS